MAMSLEIKIDSEGFKRSIDETRDRYAQAFAVSQNMIASMMQTAVVADVTSAGNFSSDSVRTVVDGDTVTTTVDVPGADIFEKGGTIYGKPLLWLPFSGTDAEGVRASNYGDQLFSVNRKTGGVPMLFAIKDHAPKYFGVSNVNVPKKFHVEEIAQRVAAMYKDVFESALSNG